ncbi:MAG: disulfide bond formation protein B [Alphaproteobacteria bacterium]|nr:disulfide bond formation protein B [Alphaproteobacteria bacterium]
MGASLAALATAYGMEFIGGVKPCVLCLYQRIPYGLVTGLALMALFLRGDAKMAVPLCGVFALIFFGGAGLALYHVGVEQGWFALPEACGSGETGQGIEALRKSLATTPPARCDEVTWSFLSVSLAGFNLLASMLLAGLACAAALSFRKALAP